MVIDVGVPLPDDQAAGRWLAAAGERELEDSVSVLNRALHAFRLVTADPYLRTVDRHQALVARVGFGPGEQVADGLWADARELITSHRRQSRAKVLQPQARLAAVLAGREQGLVCEELILRARDDLDHGRDRAATLQLLVALDAALAELAADPTAPALTTRLEELSDQRDAVAQAAQTALGAPLSEQEREAVAFTVRRIEAALRARAYENA